MDPRGMYSTWIEVDPGAIENNVRILRKMTGIQVMAVVKANGYGHGAVTVARAALRGGATWCGVARIEEALELRQASIDCPVLILGYTPREKIEFAIVNDISFAVWDANQIEFASARAISLGKNCKLHLKIDTGMSRLGLPPEDALNLSRVLSDSPGIDYEGVFTHFARADEPGMSINDNQERCFRDVLETLSAAGFMPSLRHAANSAAAITRHTSWFDLIRPGIAIYGLDPSSDCQLPSGFKPALAWKTVLSQVKTLPPGTGVSYGHKYKTTSSEKIGTLPVGYADGFRRTPGNHAIIRGKRVPVVGRVCMDQVMVQLDSVPGAREGDEAILIGSQEGVSIRAEEIAEKWGTANYEVVCGLGARVPRVYKE